MTGPRATGSCKNAAHRLLLQGPLPYFRTSPPLPKEQKGVGEVIRAGRFRAACAKSNHKESGEHTCAESLEKNAHVAALAGASGNEPN